MKIIAEIGVNHNGSIQLAKQLVDAATEAGATAVKFQTFSADRLAGRETPKVPYQLTTSDPKESHYEMLKKLELGKEQHLELLAYCNQKGVEFCSTPYSCTDAELLEEIGVLFYKTASADIIDRKLHEYIAATGKPCLIAVGMATLKEIEEVLGFYEQCGSRSGITLMHCVSSYPAPIDALNMRVISTLRDTFGVAVGYSDHAVGSTAATLAVALGASVIEKHFTLDKAMDGPDHQASSTPEELAHLIREASAAEQAMGDPVKRVQECEMEMRRVSRKSIVASHPLCKGATLVEEDLMFRRPGTGASPMIYPQYIGSRLSRDIEAGEMIEPSDLESI